jgi:hypothetical protein
MNSRHNTTKRKAVREAARRSRHLLKIAARNARRDGKAPPNHTPSNAGR